MERKELLLQRPIFLLEEKDTELTGDKNNKNREDTNG